MALHPVGCGGSVEEGGEGGDGAGGDRADGERGTLGRGDGRLRPHKGGEGRTKVVGGGVGSQEVGEPDELVADRDG